MHLRWGEACILYGCADGRCMFSPVDSCVTHATPTSLTLDVTVARFARSSIEGRSPPDTALMIPMVPIWLCSDSDKLVGKFEAGSDYGLSSFDRKDNRMEVL